MKAAIILVILMFGAQLGFAQLKVEPGTNRVVVGGSTPANNSRFSIEGNSEFEFAINAQSGNPDITFMTEGNVKAQIRFDKAPQDFAFYVLNNKVMSLNSSGDLSINGGLTATSCNCPSDLRLKKAIKSYTKGLDVINKLNPVTFQYNGKAGLKSEKMQLGLIAQEVNKLAPELVTQFKSEEDKQEYLQIKSSQIQYLLINAIKEQQLNLDKQQIYLQEKDTQIKELLNVTKALESRILSLENKTYE